MKNFNYLSLDEVLAIHYNQIRKYGGSHGVRDLDLLISAIMRAQASFAGKDLYKNIFEKTASIMISLILNHPFVDGNKRTAMVSAGRMLFINGYRLRLKKKDLVKPALNIATKKWNVEKTAKWLEENSVSV